MIAICPSEPATNIKRLSALNAIWSVLNPPMNGRSPGTVACQCEPPPASLARMTAGRLGLQLRLFRKRVQPIHPGTLNIAHIACHKSELMFYCGRGKQSVYDRNRIRNPHPSPTPGDSMSHGQHMARRNILHQPIQPLGQYLCGLRVAAADQLNTMLNFTHSQHRQISIFAGQAFKPRPNTCIRAICLAQLRQYVGVNQISR